MDYLLSLADVETRRLWQELTLGYTEAPGHPLLRREIAKTYENIQTDDILVTVPEEGVFIALNSILSPGDHVICTFPGYQSLYQVAESAGCRVTLWLPEENHGWRFNPDFLERNITPQTRLLVINFPHNPTGFLPAREDFQRIISLAEARGIHILSDEMYRRLEYDSGDRLPAACDVYSKAVSLTGMSKVFGLAGLRLGWLATQDRDLYSRIASFKDYTTICNSAASEILALIALKAADRIISEQLDRVKRNLALVDSFFARHQNQFSWTAPHAGTLGFPELKIKVGAVEFCRKVVEEAGIMLLPSSVYDYDDRHFRVGYGRENLPLVLEKFEEYLKKCKF
jgi:aspartate/methionine/tyrosine aminotransferase